jgi:hypothetical protein
MLQNAKQLQRARLSWHVSSSILVFFGLKIIGHRNPDNNYNHLYFVILRLNYVSPIRFYIAFER